MNFLDLSATSEEERRLINDILSDTSVVNISQRKIRQQTQQPSHNQHHHHSQHQPQQTHQPQSAPTQTSTNHQQRTNNQESQLHHYQNQHQHQQQHHHNHHHQHHQHQHQQQQHNQYQSHQNPNNAKTPLTNNLYDPSSGQQTQQHQHQQQQHLPTQQDVPPVTPTARIDSKFNTGSSNSKGQATYRHHQHYQQTQNSQENLTANNSTLHNSIPTPGAQHAPQTVALNAVPSLTGDMNQVMGMDVASSQAQGFAIPHSYVPPHVYTGQPFIQPNIYFIPSPYNHMPYMNHMATYQSISVMPNSQVVQPRQVRPQSNHIANHNPNNAGYPHSRSHSHHLSSQQQQPSPQLQYNNNKSDRQLTTQPELQREVAQQTETSHPDSKTRQVSDNAGDQTRERPTSNDISKSKPQNNVPKYGSNASTKNKNYVPVVQRSGIENNANKTTEAEASQTNRPDLNASRNSRLEMSKSNVVENTNNTHSPPLTGANHGDETVKLSSDEGIDIQSSLDLSKQSHEYSVPSSDQSKTSNEISSKAASSDGSPRANLELPSGLATDLKSGANSLALASSKSWADLFKRRRQPIDSAANGEADRDNSQSDNSDEDNKHTSGTTHKTADLPSNSNKLSKATQEQRSQEASRRALDKVAPKLAQKISSINLKHSLPFLKPRGFINKGNGCYINATLQALIACPPFYNLMKEIGDSKGFRRENSCTPILDSFVELFLNFPPLDANKQKNKLPIPQDQKLTIDNLQAEAIEPKCIYNVLGHIKSECLKGAQEDAEEFLSSVLNGLHDEMIGLGELQQSSNSTAQNGNDSDGDGSADNVNNDENLWREVGPRNRSLPIRTARVIKTPIQEIFGGSLFSIRTAGKDRCGHRSPFFDLQLDISSDNVKSVQDAIKSFTAPEIIHDFYCSKTKQKLDAQRRTSLDQLPPILILHLKQFVYTQDHGLKKLIKKIEYPIDFELPEGCLHEKNYPDKSLRTSRSYKLLAVVYHEGKEAIKGHYLTDVYHIGSSQWIRCDDGNLKVVMAPRIDNPDSSRTPYLLFYRRLNTLKNLARSNWQSR